MKNVMIYNKLTDNVRWSDEELFNSFKAQIDNSLTRGWKKEDIIIGTNFHFEYKGIKNKLLKNICQENPFCNKFYGMLELMETGVLKDDFWFHDQDAWQLHDDLKFPVFNGQVGGCSYGPDKTFGEQMNTCSFYVKKTGSFVIKYIVDFMKQNLQLIEHEYSDENVISYLRADKESELCAYTGDNTPYKHEYLTLINHQYNIGVTRIKDRFDAADKPVYVGGFVPQIPKSVRIFNGENNEMKLNFIDNKLDAAFRKHFEEYRSNF